MMDDFTMRARRLQAKQVPATPPVFPLPLRQHPMWMNNNELGIEALYQPDGAGFQTILKMDPWGMPQVWTVALGIDYDPALVPGVGDGEFGVTAIVNFGSGGVTQQFEVDWAEGTTFSLPMNAINVIAKYSDFTGKNNTPPDLKLRVNLSQYGGNQHNAFKSELLAPADISPVSRIPKFARRLSIMRGEFGDAWAAGTTYTFRGDPAGGFGATGDFTGAEFLANFAGEGVPIPPTARSVVVGGLVAGNTVWMQYHLAF
jgi:hypothetical protein